MKKYTVMEPTIARPRGRTHLCLGTNALTLCGQLAVGNWEEIGESETGDEATCQPCLAARGKS